MSNRQPVTIIRRGDLLLWITYIPDGEGYQDNGQDSKEPALVIAHKGSGELKAWLIGLSVAWKYANPDGYPTTWFWQKTADIGNQIGVGDTLNARRQIFSAVLDYIPQLLSAHEYDTIMLDRHTLKSVGEVAIVHDGQIIGQQLIQRPQ